MTPLRWIALLVLCAVPVFIWRSFETAKARMAKPAPPAAVKAVAAEAATAGSGSVPEANMTRESYSDNGAASAPAAAPAPSAPPAAPDESDSELNLADLAKTYAVADLATIWPQSRPLTEIGSVRAFLNTQRAVRLKTADGKGTSLRFSVVTNLEGNQIQPVSCASVTRSGEARQVGILGEGSLELRVLPQKYAYLIDIQKTYVILLLGEWSQARWEARQDNPDFIYLYKRGTDGKILYVGMFAENDQTQMLDSAPEFCRREAQPLK